MKSKHPDTETICSFAWDCTIGSGGDFPDAPSNDVLCSLSRTLRRELTSSDKDELHKAWERCRMEQAFP